MPIAMSDWLVYPVLLAGTIVGWTLSRNPAILNERWSVLIAILALSAAWTNAQTFWQSGVSLNDYLSFAPTATVVAGLALSGGSILGIGLCQGISWALGWHINEK